MRKYKYVHFLWQGGALFNKRIISLINDEENGFDVETHLFVTPYKHIYDEIKQYPNVVFEEKIPPQSAQLINTYAERGDWLFLHGMCSTTQALKIKLKNQKKIIWRTWGHDVGGYPYKKNDFLKNAVKFLLNQLWKWEVKRFRMIGTANIVDDISLQRKFGKIKTTYINYPAKNNLQMFEEIQKDKPSHGNTVNVLIGHSGIDTDNHIEVIDRMKNLYGENICMVFVLSYGDAGYVQKVKAYIEENCPKDKVRMIEEPMPIEEYSRFLADMDVAIFDGMKSYALSNISILLYFGKKIFLNRQGVLAEAFAKEKVPFRYTDEIAKMSIQELSSETETTDLSEASLFPTGYEESVRRWKKVLSALDRK